MKPSIYPFSAIVGQNEMKLALLLAAVDWRLGVLLRGEKGAGKTTAARGLAALLPEPAPFINLPIGSTEDRILGGLHLERALKGDPVLKPGLLSEAHHGVLYVDEINLLPAHLGDMLLDTAASGVNVIEREGLSASHATEFILLGSMNPEEGLLRPQLLDRFALCVDITATENPGERQVVVERRIAFDRDGVRFAKEWSQDQQRLRHQVAVARERLSGTFCSSEILRQISVTICERGVRSLRADLAAMRAGIAYAALMGEQAVQAEHVEAVLPLVLAHRARNKAHGAPPPAQNPQMSPPSEGTAQEAMERIFPPKQMGTAAIQSTHDQETIRGSSASATEKRTGPVVGNRRTENPAELNLRATLNHAVIETGTTQLRASDLHEQVRKPVSGTRYLFLIDSSGSHAAQERMRLVKGAAAALLARSFKQDDEVAMIVFRGIAAHVVLEPTRTMAEATTVLQYLPTGGRTPLAHALDLARTYITPATVLILLTDGRANVALRSEDPWQEALEIASELHCRALVIDTEEVTQQALGRSRKLAEALGAHYVSLRRLEESDEVVILLQQSPSVPR
jgi:magnesium chelatase subunit D